MTLRSTVVAPQLTASRRIALMEPRPETQTRSVQAEDLNVAHRVADYYVAMKGRAVHEPGWIAALGGSV